MALKKWPPAGTSWIGPSRCISRPCPKSSAKTKKSFGRSLSRLARRSLAPCWTSSVAPCSTCPPPPSVGNHAWRILRCGVVRLLGPVGGVLTTFWTAYQGVRDAVHELALEASLVGPRLRDFVQQHNAHQHNAQQQKPWEGTASELL